MHDYGWYIFGAYASVFMLLSLQWFLPWRRWKRYVKEQKHL